MGEKLPIKKWVSLMLTCLILFTSFINIYTPMIHAKDTDEDDKEEVEASNPTRRHNVYDSSYTESDDAVISAVKTATEYDVRLHYLVTYAFLTQKYGQVNSNSFYGGLYSGSEVGNADGMANSLDTSFSSSFVSASTEGGGDGSPHNSTVTKEDEGELNKKADALADKVAGEVSNAIVKKLGVNKLEEKQMVLNGGLYPAINYYYKLGYDSKKKLQGDPKKYLKQQLKNTYANELKLGYKGYKDAKDKDSFMENEIRNRLTVGRDGKGTVATVSKLVDDFRKNKLGLSKDKVNELDKKLSYVSSAGELTYGNAMGKINDKEMTNVKKYLTLYPEKNPKNKDGSDNLSKDIMKVIQNNKGSSEYNAYVDEISKLNGEIHTKSDAVDKDNRILSYMIIRPEIDKEKMKEKKVFDAGLEDDFENLLKKVENSELKDNKIIANNGQERSIRLNDLFYDGKNTSPLLTMNTEETNNDYIQYFFGGTTSTSNGISIGKYAGIQVEGKGFWSSVGNVLKNIVAFKSDFLFSNIEPYSEIQDEDHYEDSLTRLIASDHKKSGSKLPIKDRHTLSIDNYGNIIDSDAGTIIIPYWQNATLKTLIKSPSNSAWLSHPVFLEEVMKDKIDNASLFSTVTKGKEADISAEKINSAFSEVGGASVNTHALQEIKRVYSSASSFSDFYNLMYDDNGEIDYVVVDTLAKVITAGTKEQVKEWNAIHAEYGEKGRELYVTTGGGDQGGISANKDDYTADDLLERIMKILDYGFFEVLKLTLASMVVSIYNSAFFHYSMSSVFHTMTIADTAIWTDLVRAISLLIVGFLAVYIVWMAFLVFRQQMRFKHFMRQFLAVTLVILVPTVIYSPLINLTINKPTPLIVGNQTEQMAIMDTHLHLKKEHIEQDPMYAHMFGSGYENERDKTQDYIIDFYTTEHKNGYDITNPKDTRDLGFSDQIRSANASDTGKWNKNDVVKIGVSMFDLFDWVQAMADPQEETNETEPYQPLFTWLAINGDGRYEGIQDYTEYSFDTNWLAKRLGNKKESNDSGRITASDLFLKIYRATADVDENGNPNPNYQDLRDRILNMYQISKAVKFTHNNTVVVTMQDVESIIRDFSLTREARVTAFGNTNSPRPGVPGISDKSMSLWNKIGGDDLIIPDGDYLNLETLIDELVPVQDPTDKLKGRIVYNVNEKVLNDYINIQYIVRDALDSNEKSVTSSEFLAIVLNEFFTINKELDVHLFPTTIKPESMSLDTFVRMVFIPYHEYQGDPPGINNVAQYLSLRDNPFLLLISFIPALFMLTLWGLVYLVVFSGLMMVVMTASFVWHYIIRRDMNNKSWLGSLFIIGTFALAKIGLLALWFAMTYIMNYTYTRMGGLTYPYSYIHSWIIIAYIFICFKYLFLKVFKAIRENPQDLGANKFLEGGRNFLSSFTSRGRGVPSYGKGRGKNPFSGSSGSSVARRLKNEGAKGIVAVGNIGSKVRDAVNKMKRSGTNVGDIEDLAVASSGTGSKVIKRFPKLTKGFKGRANKTMLEAYDAIPSVSNGSGLSEESQKELKASGKVGQILSNTADGVQIATMKVGNSENAQRIAQNLQEKGVNAKVNSNGDVVFPSNEHNLNSPSVRKGLFGGLVNEIYDEIDQASSIQSNSEKKAMNYTTNPSGTVSVHVGDKGLSRSSLDNLMNSSAFSNNFTVLDAPVKQEDGTYVQGTLELAPRNKHVNMNQAMSELFEQDNKQRVKNNEQERGDTKVNQSIAYQGLADDKKVFNEVKDGMLIQGDKILYDSSNQEHVKAINKISNDFRSKSDKIYEDKQDLITRLASHTVYGGNNGFEMQYTNTSYDKEIERSAKASGLVGDTIESIVYAGEDSKNIASYMNTLKGISNVDTKDVNNYLEAQRKLYEVGENVLLSSKGADKYDKGFNKLVNLAEISGMKQEKLETFTEQYKTLGAKRDSAEILDYEYQDEVAGLFNVLQAEMQDDGIFTSAIVKEMNSKKKLSKKEQEALKDFTLSKRDLTNKGVEPEVMDKMQDTDFKDLVTTLDGFHDIEAREDGTLKIKSDDRLDESDVARLLDKISRTMKD